MANRIIFGANISPANTAMEVSINGGTTFAPLTFTTVGSAQQGVLTGVPATQYVAQQLVVRAVGYGASTTLTNPAPITVVAGASVTLTPTTANFSQNGGFALTQTSGRVCHAPFASLEVDTDAATATVSATADNVLRALSLYVAGAYVGTTTYPMGTSSVAIPLPGNGVRRVKFVESSADRSGLHPVTGLTINSLAFSPSNGAAFYARAYADMSVSIGDSISNGAVAVNRAQEAWTAMQRTETRGFTALGWGSNDLKQSLDDPTLRATYKAAVLNATAGAATKRLIMALGINDFTRANYASPALFAAASASFIDEIYAADSSIKIYLLTPIIYAANGGETGVLGGGTLPDYRAAETALQGSRPWLTIINGLSILTTADLADDLLHPLAAGQAKMAAAIGAVIYP